MSKIHHIGGSLEEYNFFNGIISQFNAEYEPGFYTIHLIK